MCHIQTILLHTSSKGTVRATNILKNMQSHILESMCKLTCATTHLLRSPTSLIKLYAADLFSSLQSKISLWTSKRLQLGHHETLQYWSHLEHGLWSETSHPPFPSLSQYNEFGEIKMDYTGFLSFIPWGCTEPCHVTVTIMLLFIAAFPCFCSAVWLMLNLETEQIKWRERPLEEAETQNKTEALSRMQKGPNTSCRHTATLICQRPKKLTPKATFFLPSG